jgi:hypothetical protein
MKSAANALKKSKRFKKIAFKIGEKFAKWSKKLKYWKPMGLSLKGSKKFSTMAKQAFKKYSGRVFK